MAAMAEPGTGTRLIVMAAAPLAEGFSLIGLETFPDATPQRLESVLEELVRSNQKAVLFLEHGLARSGGPWLKRVRDEGGRIVVTEIPPLNAPLEYAPEVDRLLRSALGADALGAAGSRP